MQVERRVHTMRNALAHAGKSSRRVVSAFIATAFAQDSAEAARAQWRRVADQLRPKLPKLALFMDEAEDDVLAYMSFPADHWPKIHSTNGLERLNGEVKRAPRSSASSPMTTQSLVWSGRSCSSRMTNGRSSAPAT
jgi:transposase-like protein